MQEKMCKDWPSLSKLTKCLLFIIVFTTLQTILSLLTRSNYFTIKIYDSSQNSIIDEVLLEDSPQRILSPEEFLQNRYVSLTGFQYCTNLDNSTFDTFAFFNAFEGSMLSKAIPPEKVINHLDMEAESIYRRIAKRKNINTLDVKRFACHAVANGDTYSNLTTSKFIHQFNPAVYFKSIIPELGTLSDKYLELPSYKLAYFIMIDEVSGFENFQMLLKSLATDGLAIILIHIDAKSPKLAVKAKTWIGQMGYKNVFTTQTSFSGRWGHSTLVNIQLNGFYELLRLSKSWEYVINLSNYDWPMRTNEQIYKFLSHPQRKGKTFINYMFDNLESTKRVASTIFRSDRLVNRKYGVEKPLGNVIRSFPYKSWIICKHHQWGIFSREFAKFTRKDSRSLEALAFFEHSWIPDEAFFGTLLYNIPELKAKTIENDYRFHQFVGFHPRWLNAYDVKHFQSDTLDKGIAVWENPKYLFVRKVSINNEPIFKDWIQKNHWGIQS